MRRMRGPLQWFLLIAGIVIAGYGVRHSLEHSQPMQPETAPPPSAAADTSAKSTDVDDEEKAADTKAAKEDTQSDDDADDDGSLDHRASDTSKDSSSVGKDIIPSPDAVACTSFEEPGSSPRTITVSAEDWTQVMNRFHEVKEDLRNWLGRHRKMFGPETYAAMAKELDGLLLQRPPADDMPDLSWRGIGVWTRTTPTSPAMIKLGGGLIHTILDHPARGKFELARLAAQTWVPCELQSFAERNRGPASVLGSLSHVLDNPWSRLTGCLGAEDQAACAPGSYSEAGWAVSSAIASMTENPGCTLPAFKTAGAVACLNAGVGGGH